MVCLHPQTVVPRIAWKLMISCSMFFFISFCMLQMIFQRMMIAFTATFVAVSLSAAVITSQFIAHYRTVIYYMKSNVRNRFTDARIST